MGTEKIIEITYDKPSMQLQIDWVQMKKCQWTDSSVTHTKSTTDS